MSFPAIDYICLKPDGESVQQTWNVERNQIESQLS